MRCGDGCWRTKRLTQPTLPTMIPAARRKDGSRMLCRRIVGSADWGKSEPSSKPVTAGRRGAIRHDPSGRPRHRRAPPPGYRRARCPCTRAGTRMPISRLRRGLPRLTRNIGLNRTPSAEQGSLPHEHTEPEHPRQCLLTVDAFDDQAKALIGKKAAHVARRNVSARMRQVHPSKPRRRASRSRSRRSPSR